MVEITFVCSTMNSLDCNLLLKFLFLRKIFLSLDIDESMIMGKTLKISILLYSTLVK